MMTLSSKERLIIALDKSETAEVKELVERLGESITVYKVGLEQYLASKGELVEYLHSREKRVFLDLKFHDIPNTMAAAARQAVRQGVWMFNIHITGREAMEQVVEAARMESARCGINRPLLIGVTVLTSLADSDLTELGYKQTAAELVLKKAKLAAAAGLDGVVSSPREAELIKDNCGNQFVTVCPGIRPEWASKGDQKRIMTPAMAVNSGADYLVIGRPVTRADNPSNAAEKILQEMEVI